MHGTYEERLKSVGCGTLRVSADEWYIRYYFSGFDARSKGTWLNIKGEEIYDYIKAYRENWKEYEDLKGKIPAGGSFRKIGLKGMAINVGPGIFGEGVCIDALHIPISKLSDLNSLISSFEDCIEKAKKIMLWLRSS